VSYVWQRGIKPYTAPVGPLEMVFFFLVFILSKEKICDFRLFTIFGKYAKANFLREADKITINCVLLLCVP
jgi:hypothetical protein